jgi:hypothetical protein
MARLMEQHRFVFSKIGSHGGLSASEKQLLQTAYRRPIRHGMNPAATVTGSSSIGANLLFINFAILFPLGDQAIAQLLIHNMMHCAGYRHPLRRERPEGASFSEPDPAVFDSPFDNGAYYGAAPLQAERCIIGIQAKDVLRAKEHAAFERCTISPDGEAQVLRST